MNIYDLLGTTKAQIDEIILNKDKHYLSYPILKSSGKKRWIDAPLGPLKEVQSKILHEILYKFKPHSAAVGFIVGCSVKEGALRHLGNKVVLCMDLVDFFGSIKTKRVFKLIHFLLTRLKTMNSNFDYSHEDVAKLVELVTFKGRLPQGSPASPALANLTSLDLDRKLELFARKHDLVYTRYADDLAFSHKDVKFDLYDKISQIIGIINIESFVVNQKKTRVMKPHKRMVITGVVINEKLGVPKYKWRNLRATLHNLNKVGKPISVEKHQQLQGYVEWIRSLNPTRGLQLSQQLQQLAIQT